ncbi:MAG: GNAT family N-acetyltransferase [Clostridia bacterium]|nr:GNAT family N-acetyltransferase [Clostridia bacterium]
MIQKVTSKEQLNICLEIIHKSFITVAADFGLTKDNCPNHTAFMPIDKLIRLYESGAEMFLYQHNGKSVCYFSLVNNGKSVELNNLSVLPEYRHLGIGKEIVEYTKEYTAKNTSAKKITIGIIEDNTILKNWYSSLGFVHTGAKRFDDLPFIVGFMELLL